MCRDVDLRWKYSGGMRWAWGSIIIRDVGSKGTEENGKSNAKSYVWVRLGISVLLVDGGSVQ